MYERERDMVIKGSVALCVCGIVIKGSFYLKPSSYSVGLLSKTMTESPVQMRV